MMGLPETDQVLSMAMNILGNGLSDANREKEALSVRETELAMRRRRGDPERVILIMQGNIANSYQTLGRDEEALRLKRHVYFGELKLYGEEDENTLAAANNYASTLKYLNRFDEAKSLLRKTIPVAHILLGESDRRTLKLRWIYAQSLYKDDGASLDDLREAVATLEDAGRIARRVMGGAHPTTKVIEAELRDARAALRARETPPSPGA